MSIGLFEVMLFSPMLPSSCLCLPSFCSPAVLFIVYALVAKGLGLPSLPGVITMMPGYTGTKHYRKGSESHALNTQKYQVP